MVTLVNIEQQQQLIESAATEERRGLHTQMQELQVNVSRLLETLGDAYLP
jgi:hypothetical protein